MEIHNENDNDKDKNFITDYLNKIIFYLFLFLFTYNINYIQKTVLNRNEIKPYIRYINDCKNHKRYNRTKIYNKNPYISICLPTLNMEKYIEKTFLSIINQSFQDFEIIIINDNSNDETEKIIKKLKLEDKRIKLINHDINKGVYYSRIEAILNSKGKYIILMDPDDLYLNENLFQELFNYNLKYNLDIIEFTVFQQIEGRRNIFYPKNHYESHYHNFTNNIIYQPDLSKILFKSPSYDIFTHTICRNIWNKMIRKKIFLDMYEFIGLDYFSNFVITADDMAMNVVSYLFANNYSNIYLPGYMYNIRSVSMSHGDGGDKLNEIRVMNYLLYFKIVYKVILKFNLDRKMLFYELKDLRRYIYFIKVYNITIYENMIINFLNEILNDKFANKIFKSFVVELLLYFISEN